MTTLDWLIVAFTALLAVHGLVRGFVVGALSLAGFIVGAFVGSRIGPLVLPHGDHSRYASLFGLGGALLVGGLLASGLEGVAQRLRAVVRIPGLRALDALAGAILTACVGLGLTWILGAVALQASGSRSLRRDIQRSTILQDLNRVLPPSGPILNALARFDPLPSVSGPAPDVAPPAKGILAASGVRAAAGSVVRVLGTACGLGIEGSGWVAGHDLVVTNAHVVAGEGDTAVQIGGHGPSYGAAPLVFDPHDDIAVLRVSNLPAPPLTTVPAPAGTAAAILGYPEDGPYAPQPGRLGHTELTETEDAYGNGPVERQITSLRGRVRPGNSGGPMVDGAGHVVATVFAAITNPPAGHEGGFAVPNAVVAHELALARSRGGRTVSSGPCAD